MTVVVSERFASAVRTEKRRLERRRLAIQGKIENLTSDLAAVDQRLQEITDLAVPEGPKKGLRGREIRQIAVRLLREDRGVAPIHYREWLALVESHGYRIGGKRVDSVFLGQVCRSSAVRATTTRGFYKLVEATEGGER